METQHRYLIVGGGLAGASAIQGIRELDSTGSILLLGAERELPYDRPPLTKALWFGKKRVEQIYLHDQAFYDAHRVELRLGQRATHLDRFTRTVLDEGGQRHRFEKLLLATGASPKKLRIPGGESPGITYYRTLEDYRRVHDQAKPGRTALIIGGGFIGSELAAALTTVGVKVTLLYPEPYLAQRALPEKLGRAVGALYRGKGVHLIEEDLPVSIAKEGERFITSTKNGAQLSSDLLIAGIGVQPAISVAAEAGLAVGDGILANSMLQSSDSDIYVAGDNAFFPYQALGRSVRIEHWDNALHQGLQAGRNMAGAAQPYTYMPYFFSDLFELGYEAVGQVDSRLETYADWQQENRTGVVYYLERNRVRGVLLCNVWEKLDEARRLIRDGGRVTPEGLRGAIR